MVFVLFAATPEAPEVAPHQAHQEKHEAHATSPHSRERSHTAGAASLEATAVVEHAEKQAALEHPTADDVKDHHLVAAHSDHADQEKAVHHDDKAEDEENAVSSDSSKSDDEHSEKANSEHDSDEPKSGESARSDKSEREAEQPNEKDTAD